MRLCHNAFLRGNKSFALAGRFPFATCYPGCCPGLIAALRLQRADYSCIKTQPHRVFMVVDISCQGCC